MTDDVGWGQRRADALGRLAEVALAADLDAGTSGDRYQVVLHVDATIATSGAVKSSANVEAPFDGALEVDDNAIHVSAETGRRIACDAAVVPMTHADHGSVLDVGRNHPANAADLGGRAVQSRLRD